MVLKDEKHSISVCIIFFAIPVLMLITGYFIYPYPPSTLSTYISFIPLFIGLILLGLGFYTRNLYREKGIWFRMIGWVSFAFYWAMQPIHLYNPSSDVFNAAVCVIGVFFLTYLAYHEWLSLTLQDYPGFLYWIAGSTFIAGVIYFTIDTGIIPILKTGLIEVVAEQSAGVLRFFGLSVVRDGANIIYGNTPITIIFACTAIQSMVLFVGMNGALYRASVRRRLTAIMVTVIPVYLLNLLRNAGVIFLVGDGYLSFEMAHNVVFKLLSLIALVILLFINFKLTPELYDEITGVFDILKRQGPIEGLFRRNLGRLRQ